MEVWIYRLGKILCFPQDLILIQCCYFLFSIIVLRRIVWVFFIYKIISVVIILDHLQLLTKIVILVIFSKVIFFMLNIIFICTFKDLYQPWIFIKYFITKLHWQLIIFLFRVSYSGLKSTLPILSIPIWKHISILSVHILNVLESISFPISIWLHIIGRIVILIVHIILEYLRLLLYLCHVCLWGLLILSSSIAL
jgi:hypothetical protein